MSTRKILSDGWLYRAARHSRLGLVLVDGAHQEALPEGEIRAFILETRQTAAFDREAFKHAISGDVSDEDCAGLLVRYRDYKRGIGFPEQAPPEVAHASRFRMHGRPVPELRTRHPEDAVDGEPCPSCGRPRDASLHLICKACGRTVCHCGACGCRTD
jgi:hypothetical protein